MESASQFSTELKVFEQHRQEWSRSHPGKFVAIRGDATEGFFASYADALRAGLKRFGIHGEFLIKQVWLAEPIYYIS